MASYRSTYNTFLVVSTFVRVASFFWNRYGYRKYFLYFFVENGKARPSAQEDQIEK